MRIAGFEETSLLDWDGNVCSVIFLGGCNFRCPFCHNFALALDDPALAEIPWQEVSDTLRRKKRWLDGVVITGGEPMMHPEIFSLCRRVRDLGLRVKIDTNGSFPYPLKQLVEMKLCDFVAMDIKAPPTERYAVAAGGPVDVTVLRRTVRLLLETGIDAEFRTTLVPGLVGPDDIPLIGGLVRGAAVHVLQQFYPEGAPSEDYRRREPYTAAQAEAMAQELRSCVREVKLRGKFL